MGTVSAAQTILATMEAHTTPASTTKEHATPVEVRMTRRNPLRWRGSGVTQHIHLKMIPHNLLILLRHIPW